MQRYVINRTLQGLFTLFIVTIIVFFFIRLTGDPVYLFAPQDARPEDINRIRAYLGLDKPVPVQYFLFFKKAIEGDFGDSIFWDHPAMEMVLDRFPATFLLGGASIIIALIIAIPIGLYSAIHKGGMIDNVGKVAAMMGLSMPVFWLGLMMILVFSLILGWLPTSGWGTVAHFIMPATALGWILAAPIMRVTRSSMLDVLDSEYVKMLRIKGLPERAVLWGHCLKNAAIPIVTITGLQLGAILRGTLVTEVVFSWPGVGKLIVEAVYRFDFPVVQAGVILMVVIFVSINLLVDIIYAYIDPRIRY
jgi:ABC-type dipeptide/oligopeptide/nickel transport system permease component